MKKGVFKGEGLEYLTDSGEYFEHSSVDLKYARFRIPQILPNKAITDSMHGAGTVLSAWISLKDAASFFFVTFLVILKS